MSNSGFIKVRTVWSYGCSSWEYRDVGCMNDDDIEDILCEEYSSDGQHSMHYRGYEWVRVKAPPVEWLEMRNFELDQQIQQLIKMKSRYQDLRFQ